MPVTIAIPGVARMPLSIAARRGRAGRGGADASRAAVSTRPKRARAVEGARRLPSATTVSALFTMIPEFRKPTNAMKRPIPAATAECKFDRDRGDDQLPDPDEGQR